MTTEKPLSATSSAISRSKKPMSIPNAPSMPSISPLLPLEPPQFPSFKELVELDKDEQLQPQKRRRILDLFDGTLGDPTPLVDDFQRHPEKYGTESHELLGQLASGTKSIEHLNDHERRILNLATFDYHQTLPPKKATDPIKKVTAKMTGTPTRRQRIRRKVQKPKPRPGIDVPATELPAYWWLQ